jgi:hypothetical protein
MAKTTKAPKGGGSKGGGNSSQSYMLLMLGILSIGGVWVYGFTGLLFAILGLRYAKKNSKASNSPVGHTGKVLSIIGLVVSIIYLVAWSVVLLAQW